jgi:hypothetical protein
MEINGLHRDKGEKKFKLNLPDKICKVFIKGLGEDQRLIFSEGMSWRWELGRSSWGKYFSASFYQLIRPGITQEQMRLSYHITFLSEKTLPLFSLEIGTVIIYRTNDTACTLNNMCIPEFVPQCSYPALQGQLVILLIHPLLWLLLVLHWFIGPSAHLWGYIRHGGSIFSYRKWLSKLFSIL